MSGKASKVILLSFVLLSALLVQETEGFVAGLLHKSGKRTVAENQKMREIQEDRRGKNNKVVRSQFYFTLLSALL